MSLGATTKYLLVRARSRLGAIPLGDVIETMRPLALEPLTSMPAFMLGLAVIRETPLPVVDLGALLGSEALPDPRRYVTVRTGARSVALAVEGVLGVRELEASRFESLPPLFGAGAAAPIHAVGTLDRQLVAVLATTRLVPDELWRALDGEAAE